MIVPGSNQFRMYDFSRAKFHKTVGEAKRVNLGICVDTAVTLSKSIPNLDYFVSAIIMNANDAVMKYLKKNISKIRVSPVVKQLIT